MTSDEAKARMADYEMKYVKIIQHVYPDTPPPHIPPAPIPIGFIGEWHFERCDGCLPGKEDLQVFKAMGHADDTAFTFGFEIIVCGTSVRKRT